MGVVYSTSTLQSYRRRAVATRPGCSTAHTRPPLRHRYPPPDLRAAGGHRRAGVRLHGGRTKVHRVGRPIPGRYHSPCGHTAGSGTVESRVAVNCSGRHWHRPMSRRHADRPGRSCSIVLPWNSAGRGDCGDDVPGPAPPPAIGLGCARNACPRQDEKTARGRKQRELRSNTVAPGRPRRDARI
jgi:hypothetical protein